LKQENSNAFFATLITIGDIDNNLVTKIDKDNKNIEISTGKKVYNINVETMLGEEEIINVSNNEINSADKKQILSFNRFNCSILARIFLAPFIISFGIFFLLNYFV